MNNLNEFEFNHELLQENHEFEHNELELTHELMEVAGEQEFEYFLGNIWNAAKKLYNSPQGQAVKKDFITGAKSFGRKMIPSVARNLGGYFDGSRGAKYGGQIGDAAGNWIFGEADEAEVVNYLKVVRKAANYLNRSLAQGNVNINTTSPRQLVTAAINQAARPIYRNGRRAQTIFNPTATAQNQGRWIRHGNKLILQGA